MGAALNGHLAVLRLLLARGAALDTMTATHLGYLSGGRTAFHYACQTNQPECAEALARAGCDVGIKDTNGETGRQMAERQGHVAVVERLRAVVAEQLRAAQAVGPAPEPESVATVGGGESTDQLVQAARKGDGAAVARLLAAGADPSASAPVRLLSGEVYQNTPLAVASENGRLEAVRLLLDGGAVTFSV
jgi:ankyrin repeat protein